MKFCWTTIMVNDLEESLKFYQEIIGLPVNRRFKGEK
ncbi:MAG: VOC family protein, partial [Actinomycetota bacterium]|nr:VOC family protein [Actinomycetota bacterium]